MHLLEVCRSFPAHRAGGLEWHALDLVEALEERGHRVSIVTTPLPEESAGSMPKISGKMFFLGKSPGVYSPDFFFGLRGLCARISREDKIDAIHAQGFSGPRISGAAELPPVVTTVHGTLYSETALRRELWRPAPLSGKLAAAWRFKHRLALDPLWRRFLRGAPRLVVDSDFSRRELEAEFGAPVAAETIPLGVDLKRFPECDRAAARKSFGFSEGEFVVLLGGRQEKQKRHDFALRVLAAAALPQLRILVVGDGSLRLALEALAGERQLPATFTGVLPSDRLADAYAAADLFANPDGGAPAFGLANAEALLQGTPVLASDSGAAGEVLQCPRDGTIVPMDAAEETAWVAAVRTAAARSDTERAMRRDAARARFDRGAMAARYEDVFLRVAAG